MQNFPSSTLPPLHIKVWLNYPFPTTSPKYSTFTLSLLNTASQFPTTLFLPNLPPSVSTPKPHSSCCDTPFCTALSSPSQHPDPHSCLSPQGPLFSLLSTQSCLFDPSLDCAGYTTLSSIMLHGGSLSNITNICRVFALPSSPHRKMCAQHSVRFWDFFNSTYVYIYICTCMCAYFYM